MIRWIQLWIRVEAHIPELFKQYSGVDEDELLMALVGDAVQSGRLTMWCGLEVDGIPMMPGDTRTKLGGEMGATASSLSVKVMSR
jgi:hypothetical protein